MVAIHIPYRFGDVVVIVTYGQLRHVPSSINRMVPTKRVIY